MKTKHTPGPWMAKSKTVIERPIRVVEHIAIVPQGGPSIAYLPNGRDCRKDGQEANARLIAAAPAMLAALEGFMEYYEAYNPMSDKRIEPYAKEAREAIALATKP